MFSFQRESKQNDRASIRRTILEKESELQELKRQLALLDGVGVLQDSNSSKEPDQELFLEWMNNLNVAIEIIDNEGRFIFVNDFFCKRIGYSRDQLLVMKVADVDFYFQNEENWDKHFIENRLAVSMLLESVHTRSDGSTYPVEVKCRYVLIDGKEYILAVTTDISERKKKEKMLLRSEALLNEIMNNSEEAFFLVDSEKDIIVDCNHFALTMFGFTDKSALIGTRGNRLQNTEFTEEKIAEILFLIRTKGHFEMDIEYKHQNGDIFWGSLSATLVKIENEAPYFLVRITDIDNRKKIEQGLKRSEKRYKDLVRYNQTLICTHDVEGKILTINPACLKSLDYQNEEDLVGHNLRMLFDEKNMEGYHEYLRQINEIGESQGIMQVINKYGKKMYWVYRNYKVEEEGSTPYVVGSAQDITDRMIIERELKKAKVIAEQSLKARELFLANISHEVRTPLHGIMGVTNLLRRTSTSPEQDNYLKIVRHSSESLLVIMNDILDMAKMESGKFELERIPFDLFDTVTNSAQHLSLKAKEKGVQFKITLPHKDITHLMGDPYRLSQIIINLTNNAIKFTESGKIELALEVLHDINEKLTIEIKVSDTGIGIPENKLDTIFEEFTQADASHTRLYGGTGLGLSICKKLVELQNGSIYANSTVGVGSEFGFILHFDKVEAGFQLVEELAEIDYEQFKGLRVLLAEDNAVNQLIARTLIEMKGAKVDVADCGAAAIDLFKRNDYDLILMDIQMPDLDGDQVANLMRGVPNRVKAEIPIIALTANAMKGDHDKYLLAGMNSYLSKPYSESELFHKIATTLNLSLMKKTPPIEAIEKNNILKPSTKPYNLSELVEMFGDKAPVAILMQTFIATTPNEVAILRAHIANSDLLGIKNSLHKIRPSLLQMQNEELTRYLGNIKEQLTSEDISLVRPPLEKLLKIVESIVEEMKADPDLY